MPSITSPAPDLDVVLPPSWAFGVLYGGYNDQAGLLAKLHKLLDGGFPVDALWTDSCFWDITGKGPKGYMDFRGDRAAYPDPAAMWGEIASHGIRNGVWTWERILRGGNEAVFEEFERNGWFSGVDNDQKNWHTDGSCPRGFIDYRNPRAARAWMEKLRPFFDMGLDFLKLDAGPEPEYLKAGFDATAEFGRHTRGRGFILHHAGDLARPDHKRYPAAWSGDSIVGWTQPGAPDYRRPALGGLAEQVPMLGNPAHPWNAIPFLANDTGGFTFGRPDDELFIRWVQFSSLAPLFTVFGNTDLHNDSNAPYSFSAEAQENFRRFAALRLRLFPYLYSIAHARRWEGTPTHTGDGVHTDQFQLGPWLVVAPVVQPGQRERHVFLPRGEWIDYWTGERTKEFWSGVPVMTKAPLDRMPIYVKPGAILPQRLDAPRVEAGSNDPLVVDCWPRGRSHFLLREDDGLSNDYVADGVAGTLLECEEREGSILFRARPVEGSHKGMPAERSLVLRLNGVAAAKGATANGEALAALQGTAEAKGADGWRAGEGTGPAVARVTFPVKRGTEILVALAATA